MKHLMKLALVAALAVFSAPAFAQTTPTAVRPAADKTPAATVEEFRLASRLTNRAMPYRVVLPKAYEKDKTRRFPVIYLLHGLTGRFSDWTDRARLAEHAAEYDFIIVTPEGGDGWYTDSASVAADRYESYLVAELIPEIDAKFRTRAERGGRVVAGLSMGGYGALKFGLKYPDKFVLAGSFSGALGAASWSAKELAGGWKALADSIAGVYGADDSPTRRANDIYRLVREMSPEGAKTLPFLYLDCGTEDFLIQQNRDFAGLLFEKKLPHEFRQLPGRHDWPYWNAQVQEFLRIAQKFVK